MTYLENLKLLIPESGVYRVTHSAHRLPHEVTLLKGQPFPHCAKCEENVAFEAVHLAPYAERRGQVVLYELPELHSEHSSNTVLAS